MPDPVEFAPLNFDFHRGRFALVKQEFGFSEEKTLAVSYLRIDRFKRIIPSRCVGRSDSLLQWTGGLETYSPSIFMKSMLEGVPTGSLPANPKAFFKCPECETFPLMDEGRRTCPPGQSCMEY